jgi:hypothetical protein
MKVDGLVEAAAAGRRAALEMLRDELARALSDRGHTPGCDCECGVAGDGRVVAVVAKQLAAIVKELDELPGDTGEEAGTVVSLTARIQEKAAQLRRDAAASA